MAGSAVAGSIPPLRATMPRWRRSAGKGWSSRARAGLGQRRRWPRGAGPGSGPWRSRLHRPLRSHRWRRHPTIAEDQPVRFGGGPVREPCPTLAQEVGAVLFGGMGGVFASDTVAVEARRADRDRETTLFGQPVPDSASVRSGWRATTYPGRAGPRSPRSADPRLAAAAPPSPACGPVGDLRAALATLPPIPGPPPDGRSLPQPQPPPVPADRPKTHPASKPPQPRRQPQNQTPTASGKPPATTPSAGKGL